MPIRVQRSPEEAPPRANLLGVAECAETVSLVTAGDCVRWWWWPTPRRHEGRRGLQPGAKFRWPASQSPLEVAAAGAPVDSFEDLALFAEAYQKRGLVNPIMIGLTRPRF